MPNVSTRAPGGGERASPRAGAETREHVAAVGGVEVAEGVSQEPAAGGPAAAAQDLVRRPEPGLRVFLVWIGDESRIGGEIARGPFPDVAEHLPAAVGAVAFRVRGHVHRPAGAAVEIGAALVRRVVAPGETAPRRRGGRELPFRLGGKPPARPGAERLRLVPTDVDDRRVRSELAHAVIAPLA